METTKDKVEKWLSQAPKEIQISPDCDIEEISEQVKILGKIMPKIVKGGYRGTIRFNCRTWEEK